MMLQARAMPYLDNSISKEWSAADFAPGATWTGPMWACVRGLTQKKPLIAL